MKSTFFAVSVLLTLPSIAPAAIQATFILDPWNATEIVVATEGDKIDGKLTVLESWHGTLKKGESIFLPELSKFSKESEREVHPGFGKDNPPTPTHVSCQRMILFLAPRKVAHLNSRWTGAKYGCPHLSSVWVEGKKTFTFNQPIIPGDVMLMESWLTETEIKERVTNILKVKQAITTAPHINDPRKRAEALAQVSRYAQLSWRAENAFFETLNGCGEHAMTVLKGIIQDNQQRKMHPRAISTLASVGKDAAGPDLAKWLKSELQFWKAHSPTDDGVAAREHEARTLALLSAISKTKFVPATSTVLELRTIWESSVFFRDAEHCDEVLAVLGWKDARNEDDAPTPIRISISWCCGIRGGPMGGADWVLNKSGESYGIITFSSNTGSWCGKTAKFRLPAEVYGKCEALLLSTDFFHMESAYPENPFEPRTRMIEVTWGGRKHHVRQISPARVGPGFEKLWEFMAGPAEQGKLIPESQSQEGTR